MSQQMKYLVYVLGAVVVIAVVLTMFGKPPNLPLGPLQGMLAKDDAAVAEDTTVTPAATSCPPGQVSAATLGAAAPATAGTGAVDPATGAATTDPAAAAADPNAAAGATPSTTDPSATVGAGADGWSDGTRVVAAGPRIVDGRVVDEPIYAADAVTDPAAAAAGTPAATDPATGAAAVDPATGAAAVDPATGAPAVDPATGGAVDPTTGAPLATDPNAAAAATPTDCVADPNATPGTGTTTPGPGTTTPGTGTTAPGTGTTAPATNQVSKATTDGTNIGNSPEALRAAIDASGVLAKAQITVQTTATLAPGAGGYGSALLIAKYRKTVTAAVLVIKLTDPTALQQWTTAGAATQTTLVKSFVTRLGKNYPAAARSISVVDSTGNLLAVGDAPARGVARVKLLK